MTVYKVQRTELGIHIRRDVQQIGGWDMPWHRHADTPEAAVADVANGMNEPLEHFYAEEVPRTEQLSRKERRKIRDTLDDNPSASGSDNPASSEEPR